MHLFCLEVRRMLKSQRTLILLIIAFVLSLATAYLPITFESINQPNPDGSKTMLKALSERYADPLTGMGSELMEIDPADVAQTYYQRCVIHLVDVMNNEQRNHPAAQKQAGGAIYRS